jgi:dolichol-phosphate mannosyltransferase
LTLVLPTYKERENLPELFDRIDRALDGLRFGVIVVDDDSPDQTWLVAQDFRQRYRWLRVIRRRGLRGLSSAVICGFRQSRGKKFGADGCRPATRCPSFTVIVATGGPRRVAIATRRGAGGSDGEWSPFRRFGSVLATGSLAFSRTRAEQADGQSHARLSSNVDGTAIQSASSVCATALVACHLLNAAHGY